MKTLESWLAAHSALERAAAEFLKASEALDTSTTNLLTSEYSRSHLEGVIADVRSRMNLIPVVENQMTKSRKALHGLLNRSVTLIPINRLDTEVLSHIFAIYAAMSPCEDSGASYNPILDVMLVCVNWCRVIVDSPLLWSHIDLSLDEWTKDNSLKRPYLQLGRCGAVPLHIHIEQRLYGGIIVSYPHQNVSSFCDNIVQMLEQRIGRITSLTILGSSVSSLADRLFNAYPIDLWVSLRNLVADPFITAHDEGILPLPSFSRLFELSIGSLIVDRDRFSHQLLGVLLNCPELHTLRLRSMMDHVVGLWEVHPDPSDRDLIVMPRLRLIEVDSSTVFFLSSLDTGLLELDLRLSSWTDEGNPPISTLQSFLSRSIVVALRLPPLDSMPMTTRFMLEISGLLPHTRVLHFTGSWESVLQPAELIFSDPISRFPSLKSLCFSGWIVSLESIKGLKALLEPRQLSSIAFLGCEFTLRAFSIAPYDDYRSKIPQTEIAEGLALLAKQVIIQRKVPTETYSGVDQFITRMIEAD